MKFVTLEPEDFRKFADKNSYKSFYQTPEIAKLREENGWTAYYLGVAEAEDGSSAWVHKLVAAAMIVAKPTFLGKSTFYCPGGPLIDYENTSLVNFFFKNLKAYIKSHNGYLLHIEPYYELIERDRDGLPKEKGFNHKKAIKNLVSLGFKKLPHSDEPQYSFALELKNRSAEQIFAEMKRNTRNHIRKAEKMGVKIRELKREELGIFKQITESTSHRRNFTDKPLSYYEKMYDLFNNRDEVKFLLAEVENGDGAPSTFRNTTSSCLPLSAAMFMLYGNEVIYLFSGSDEKYMKDYNAQYLIQWHMIKYAIDHKYERYNFYGINGLPDKNSKDYGIYDFKKGFTSEETGRVIELLGAYELPVNRPFYYLHDLLSNLKRH